MARYIDADKLIEMCKRQIECEWNTIAAPNSWADAFQDFSDLVEQTPTADVVPKSEVAREIFEEIEKIIASHGITIGLVYDEGAGATTAIDRIHKKIAELKMKYTEK